MWRSRKPFLSCVFVSRLSVPSAGRLPDPSAATSSAEGASPRGCSPPPGALSLPQRCQRASIPNRRGVYARLTRRREILLRRNAGAPAEKGRRRWFVRFRDSAAESQGRTSAGRIPLPFVNSTWTIPGGLSGNIFVENLGKTGCFERHMLKKKE